MPQLYDSKTRPFPHCVSHARSWLPGIQMWGSVGEQTCPGSLSSEMEPAKPWGDPPYHKRCWGSCFPRPQANTPLIYMMEPRAGEPRVC